MKKVLFILAFFGLFSSMSYAQNPLYDGWISFTSSSLGNNEYEYDVQWGASTALSQDEMNNLFPSSIQSYHPMDRGDVGIGAVSQLSSDFALSWTCPVDIYWTSEMGSPSDYPLFNKTSLDLSDFLHTWTGWEFWGGSTEFKFRSVGYTGVQCAAVTLDYYAYYWSTVRDPDPRKTVLVMYAGDRLKVTGSSEPIPEPATLILLSSGLLGIAGANRLRRRIKS